MLTPKESSMLLARLQSAMVPSPKMPTKRKVKVDRFDRTGWMVCRSEGSTKYLPSLFSPHGIVVLGDRSMNTDTLISWAWASIKRYGSRGLLDRVRAQYGSEADLVQDILLLMLQRSAPFATIAEEWAENNRGEIPVSAWLTMKRSSTYWSTMQAQSAYRFALGATLEKVRYVNGVRAMESERFPDGVHVEYRMEMVRGNAPQRISEMYDAPAKEESAIMDSELYAEMEKLIGADIVEQVKIGIEQAAKVSKPRKDRRIDARTNRYESRFDLTTIVATAKGISRSTAGRMLMEARDKCIQKGMVAAA